jgi:hypothetical protein
LAHRYQCTSQPHRTTATTKKEIYSTIILSPAVATSAIAGWLLLTAAICQSLMVAAVVAAVVAVLTYCYCGDSGGRHTTVAALTAAA